MAQIVRLGGTPRPSARPQAAASVDPRRGLLIAALVTVIALALSVIIYVSLPRTPANIVAGAAPTPDVADDSTVFDPKAAEAQHQVQQAQQEKEDSAVFGQSPTATSYQYSSR